MKNNFAISFITITLLTVAASEDCDKCVRKDKCLQFGKLDQQAQAAWQTKHPCSAPDVNVRSKVFGFDTIAKGDYVCCSNNIWEAANNDASATKLSYNSYADSQPPNSYDYPNSGDSNNDWGSDKYNNGGGYDNGYDPNQGNKPSRYNSPNTAPKNYFNVNNNPYATSSPFSPGNGPRNNGDINQGGQCPITSFPPAPETGCCGREATDSDRIIGHQPRQNPTTAKPSTINNDNYYDNWTPEPQTTQSSLYNPDTWTSWLPKLPNLGLGFNSLNRVARSIDDNIGVRIAGGHETELEQFPWTVLLKITFDYGNRKMAYNCGGSLISSRYVLTAAHCGYDKGGTVVDLDVYLAEYDKRTFPVDCKIEPGEGKKCIKNIVMKAESVTLHPQYDDAQLKNDIALIRLNGNAPYTDYIRPICLPSIDIDTPQFFNLRLAVAGWGRNGRFRSDVKQSTVVNLVPQDKCVKYYPGLTRRSLCAAGYTGEDTCKGDSGGPLMTLYGGKYEVVGVVSGKRADSPCGTSVPSLYTNVYHYLDWIRSTIKN